MLDGGLSFVLSRFRNAPGVELGRYLALTGAALTGLDLLAAGISTHHMFDDTLEQLHRRCGVQNCCAVPSVAVLSLAASPPVARSFADLTYEPDSLVEDVVARAALAYYRLDLGERELNPYKELFKQGDHNEEERLRWVMLRRPVTWLTWS